MLHGEITAQSALAVTGPAQELNHSTTAGDQFQLIPPMVSNAMLLAYQSILCHVYAGTYIIIAVTLYHLLQPHVCIIIITSVLPSH